MKRKIICTFFPGSRGHPDQCMCVISLDSPWAPPSPHKVCSPSSPSAALFRAQFACCFLRRVAYLLSPEFLSPPTVCQVFLYSLGYFCLGAGFVFLASSSPDLCVFFSFHLLTYLLRTIIPSHALPSEQVSFSLHLAGLSLHGLPACLPQPACLALPIGASHSMLVLGSLLQVYLCRSSYWHVHFSISFISLHFYCWYTLKYRPYLRLSSLGFHCGS